MSSQCQQDDSEAIFHWRVSEDPWQWLIYCGSEWRTLPDVWGSTLSTKGNMPAVPNFGLGSNPND